MSYLSLLADKLYTFDSALTNEVELNENNNAETKKIKPILIIGKEYCFESTREIPIGSLKEAIKAARLVPCDAPFAGKTYFEVNRIDHNRSVVTFFTVRQTVYNEVIDKCWIIIPEPMLLKRQLSNELIDSATLFSLTNARIIEAKQIGHKFKCKIITQQGNGLTQPIDVEEITVHSEYINAVTRAISELPAYMYFQFLNFDRVKNWIKSVNWKVIFGISLATCSLYMLAISLWLSWHEEHLKNNIQVQSNELDTVFFLQNKLLQKKQNLSFWRNESKLKYVSSPVWQIFLDLAQSGVEILSFGIEGEDVTIRAKTDKATDAITYLANLKTISTPESTAPVVRSRGKEIFSLKFKLRQKDSM